MDPVPLYKVWAKTDLATRLPVVSLLTHSVNVGVVAGEIVARLSPAAAGVFSTETWRGLVSLAALHDIGKASPGFLQKCQAWFDERVPDAATSHDWLTREKNHAVVSHLILGKLFGHPRMTGYAVAVGGHHGKFAGGKLLCPGGTTQARTMEHEYRDAMFQGARQDLLARLLAEDIFGPLPGDPLPGKRTDEAKVVFLTGFITMSDWIGSDEGFFPLCDPSPDDEKTTLSRAAGHAAKALAALHWGATAPVPERSFGALFRAPDGDPYSPNALQTALPEIVRGPGLYIVEAPMGFGKTEAALHAAYLRWTQGGERGLYFALPTQVTSDRIFERLNAFLERAVSGPNVSTLVHGGAWLREERAIDIHPADKTDEAAANATDARQWFASGRRALLAPFGAGTLDQALLGVLPAKHCGLRLFALAGKVVVFDEVHSYDPYTSTLLDALIGDLLGLGCTVIVLTATLPTARKAQLLTQAGVKTIPDSARYPLITAALTGTGEAEVHGVAWDSELDREVRLEHLAATDPEVWNRACDAAEAGACVLIIRNTVDQAQKTFRALRCQRREDGPEVALLHSRFPRWRRDELETLWLSRLGKPSNREDGPTRPRGCILVATQVVEQSVDIDADLLITDLAPTDPLFQRLGRLHRHGSMFKRPKGFEKAQAWVLHPALDDAMDAREIKKTLGASGKVYPPATLFRSWRIWHEQPSVVLPHAIRKLLDRTYPTEEQKLAEPASPGLQALDEELKAKTRERVGTASGRMNRLGGNDKDDREDGTLTRWNEQPSADVLLLREAPRGVAGGDWEIVLLDGSTVRVNAYQWSLPAAQNLHRNMVSVPLYTVQGWMKHKHRAFEQYFEGSTAIAYVVDEQILPLERNEEQLYALRWNMDEGVNIHRTAATRQRAAEIEDEYQDDD